MWKMMVNLEVKYETCWNETCFKCVLRKGVETVKISLKWCWGWHYIDVHADGSTSWRIDCSAAEMCIIVVPLLSVGWNALWGWYIECSVSRTVQAAWGWSLSCSTLTAIMLMLGCFLMIVEGVSYRVPQSFCVLVVMSSFLCI
jgi:hypothetical protein